MIIKQNLHKINSSEQYKMCTFYIESAIDTLEESTFENCSFRGEINIHSVKNCQFINCNFSVLAVDIMENVKIQGGVIETFNFRRDQESIEYLWYTKVRKHFHSLKDENTTKNSQSDVMQMEYRLKNHFEEFAKNRNRVRLPHNYARFLQVLDGYYYEGEPREDPNNQYYPYCFHWYDLDEVVENTKYLNELSRGDYREDLGLWILIAHYSDKHDMYLCCDTEHPDYGAVMDCHDSHPWYDVEVIESSSFFDYLQSFVGE
ncbi:SMI1/KNR4 family protein [Candidatus Uabimicrobium amorphum]|uniref:Knr4/Smi1-like domain-containing protein n=1 Tax=Uabimicrobium amorphum TaxID=2596890 RepID=A0A5S9IJQ0_UABAM|nr:SMI1/KNR4 family protein [Candidatus Uabimicrobium amorphum]BBM82310.1 hypothetical protein UABAM_00653 [Candidatus Uabimicrobium amorphum]